jgi:hypothetical protein
MMSSGDATLAAEKLRVAVTRVNLRSSARFEAEKKRGKTEAQKGGARIAQGSVQSGKESADRTR